MSFNRSLAVKKQWRDRKGRWVEMGKGVRFFNISTGKFELGTFTGPDSNGNARIKLPNGNYVSVPRSSVESYSVKGTLNRVKDKIRQTFKKASLKKAGISTHPKYLELAEMPSIPPEKKKFSELPDGTHFTLPHKNNENSISRNMPLFTKNSANDNKVKISDSDNYRALIAGKEDTRVSVSTSKDKESFSVSAKVNDDDEVFVFDDKALNDFAELNPHSTITQTAANDKSDNLKGATYDKDGNLTLPESAKPTDGKDIKTHDTFYIPADENLSTGSRTLKTEADGIPASGLVVSVTPNFVTYLDDNDVEKTVAKVNFKAHLQNESAEDRAIENGTISREKHSQALPVDVDPNTPEYENTPHTAEGVPGKSNPTRIINDAQPPQTQSQDQTQTQPQKKSIPTSLDDFPDIKRNKPEALEGESYAPTQEQQDVIDAVLAGKNVKVQALAGAGKTSTVEALARRLQKDEPKSRGIYIAFNKSVQTEAEGRMPKNVEPRTGHSLAYAWANKDSKARTLIDKIQKRDAHKNFTPLKKNSDIADHLGIEDLPETGDADLDEATEAVRKRSSITSGVVETIKNFQVSADDEISEKHLPARMSSLTAEQKKAVVGHAQKYWDDMNSPEGKLPITHDTYRKAWALSKPNLGSPSKGGGKRKANLLFLDECQPEGTKVLTVNGEKNIEDIEEGDMVISYNTSAPMLRMRGSEVSGVSVRNYRGNMIHASIGENTSRYTENHKVIAKIGPALDGKTILYMMRRGDQYRIGVTTTHYNRKNGNPSSGLADRIRTEKAESAWILDTFDDRREALLYENLYSFKFGIPTLVWNARHGKFIIDQPTLDRLWDEIGDNKERATELAEAMGRNIDYPLIDVVYNENGNRAYYTPINRPTVIHAVNLMDGMELLDATTLLGRASKVVSRGDDAWKPVSLKRELFDGPVWSLSVDSDETYVADGIVTHNCQDTPPVLAKVIADQNMRKVLIGDQNQAIYGFSGATDYLSEADADIELPLSQSFRFGPKVADAGNRFLQLLKAPHRVKGGGPESSIVKGMEDADAVLVRSNRGLIAEAIKELSAGRIVSTPKGTKTNLKSLVDSAIYLKGGYKKRPYNMHEDFDAFNSWNEVSAEINSTGNQTLKNYQGLFDSLEINGETGLPALYNLRDLVNTIREPSNESEMVDMFRKDGELILKDRAKIGKFQNSPIEKLSLEMAKRNGAKAKYEKGKYHEYVQALEEQGGLKSREWAYDPKQDHWKFLGDDIDAEEKQMKYDLFGLGDVTISTAHKSKGLEWDRVRISDDFSKPEIDENTGEEVFPSDEELMLSYVAVTRAKKELDPGGLDWVYDRTDENGGVKVKEDSSDKVQETHSESEIDPVSTSTDTTEDVDSSIFDAPEIADSNSDSNINDVDLPEDSDSDSDSDPNEPEDVDLPEDSEPEEQEPASEPEPESEPQPEKKKEEPLQRGDVVTDSHGREWNVLAVSKKGNVIVKNEDGDYESFDKEEVSKNEPTPTPEPEPEPIPEPEEAETLSTYRQNAKNMPTDVEDLEKYMNQTSGSNPGGFYVDPETGRKFYVKKSKSLDHARNEALASEFYSEMGIKNAEQHVIVMPDGSAGTISELVPNAKEDLNTKVHGDQDYLSEIYKGFAADVFLANWDVAGLVYDNIVTDDKGDPVRVDPGGALKYRAQGAPKGNLFGDEATEWDTLRDPSMNYSSSVVFKNMTDEELFKSAERVSALTDDKIDDLVTGQMGFTPESEELAEKLKKRRDNIRDRADALGVSTLPPSGSTDEMPEVTPVHREPEESPLFNPETGEYSEDGIKAVMEYVEDSGLINEYLHSDGESAHENEVRAIEKNIADLKSMMTELDSDKVIYRGLHAVPGSSLSNSTIEIIQSLNTPGAIVQNKGFSSTSKSEKIAKTFSYASDSYVKTKFYGDVPSKAVLEITPKGVKGHTINYDPFKENSPWFSDFLYEEEVILDESAIFVVDSVDIADEDGEKYSVIKVSAYDKSALEDGTIKKDYPETNLEEVGDTDAQEQGQESTEIPVPQGNEDSVSPEEAEETEEVISPVGVIDNAENGDYIEVNAGKIGGVNLDLTVKKVNDDEWEMVDIITGKTSGGIISREALAGYIRGLDDPTVYNYGPHSDYYDPDGGFKPGVEVKIKEQSGAKPDTEEKPKPETPKKADKFAVDDDGNPLDANGNAIKKGSNVKLYKANGDLWIEGTVAAISGDKKRVKVIDSATGKASYRLPHKIHVDSDGQADVLPESPYKTEQKVNEALAGLEDGDHINIHNTDTSYTKQTNDEGDPVFVEDGSEDAVTLNVVVDNNSETKTDNGVSYSNLTFSPESAEVSPKSQDGGESHPSLPENMGVDSLGFQYIKNSEGTKMFIGDTVADKKGNLIGKIVAFDGGKLLGKRLKVERPDGTFSYRKPEALYIGTPPEDEDLPKPVTLMLSDVDDEPTPQQTGEDKSFNILPASERGASGDGYHKSGPWGKFGASGLMITADDPMTGETNYLLVQRGNSLSSNKGKWQLPGGALDENETIYQGAARETHEEIGLTQDQLNDLELVGEHTTDNGEGWSYSNIAVKSKDMFMPTATDSESGKVSWFTYDEIQEMKNKGDLVPAFADSIDDVLDLFGDNKSKPQSDEDKDSEPSDADFEEFWKLGEEVAKEEAEEAESLETSNEVEGVDFVYGKDGSVIKENDIVSWPSQKKTGQVVGIYNENKITVNFDGTLKNLNPKQKLQASLEKPVEDVPEGMPVEPDLTDLDNQIKALENEAQLDYSVQDLEDDFEHMFNVVKKHNSTKSSYKDAYHYTMHGHKLVEKSGTPEELKENAKFMNTKNLLSDEMLDKLNASIDKSIKANEENEKKMNELLDEKQSLLSEYKKEKMEWAKANNIKVAHSFNQNAVPASSGDKSNNNPENWSQAVGKTANLEDSIEHMINNPKSAANGVSVLLDSTQVENLQMRVTGYTDKNGNKKFHTRFNISQSDQKEFANNLVKTFGAKNVTTATGGKFSTMKIDGKGEMVEYEGTYSSSEDSTAKTQIIHLDDGTVIRYSFDGKKDTYATNTQQSSVFNGRVEIITDQENKSAQIFKALEAIKLDKPKPSSIDDVKRTAAKLLMERLSGTLDIDDKHPTDEQLNTYMESVEKDYGITYEDIQVSMDDLGNTVFMLSQDGLNKIKKKYKGLPKAFKHTVTGSDGIISMMTSSSPGVMSTYNRWESGIQVGGMSSFADMLTGGAKYVFTRPVKTQDSSTGLFIDPDSVLRNLGSHYSGNDIYGKTIKGSSLWNDLSSHKGKYPASAETIIPNGLDVSTWMYFTVAGPHQRDTYISKLKKAGYNEINGIPVDKFIRTSDMPFPTKEDISETVSDSNAVTLPAGEIGAPTP